MSRFPASPSRSRGRLLGLLAFGCLAGGLLVPLAGAETRVGGELEGDTVWNRQGSPYIVTRDVTVPAGITLTVEPGTVVRFKPNINDQEGANRFDLELRVLGRLVAHGAENDTISFTSDASDPTWYDWQGIVVEGTEASLDLRAARVEYANQGIRCWDGRLEVRSTSINFCSQQGIAMVGGEGVFDDLYFGSVANEGGTGIAIWLDRGARAEISNSFFVGVQNAVSWSRGSGGSLHHSVISLCPNFGITVRNSDPEIHHCSITGNEYGILLSAGAAPDIHHNNLFNNGVVDVWIRDYQTDPVVKIDLSENWWSTDDIVLVEERVLDGVDDPAVKALAILEPFLPEAVSTDPNRP